MDWRNVNFDWNRARAFLVTAELGSFSAGARALDVAQPTIGRQVAELEEELGYLDRIGNPKTPEDLSRAEFFGFDRTDVMITEFRAIGIHLEPRNFPIVTGNHLVQWELAKRGLGICAMIEEIGDAEPSVCRVLESLPPLPIPIWLTSHRELRTSKRMRVVFELLAEGLQQQLSQARSGRPAT